jgi:signal transduction histidine kinase/DNA-binding response OmpR family regulator
MPQRISTLNETPEASSARPDSPSWLGLVAVALLLVLALLFGVQARQTTPPGAAGLADTAAGTASANPAPAASGAEDPAEADVATLRLRLAQLEGRAQVAAAHNRQGLVLTGLLALLMLAAAALALRQVRQFRERRAQLEALAQTLRDERRDAEAASRAKSAFLASLGHEIRTPFHSLMGLLSLLREANLTPRQIDHLRLATQSADHLMGLLNDILDMAQLESGRLSLAPAGVTLRALLRDVEAQMRPQAAQHAIALHLDAEPAVPERALLDATRVKQIVVNLLAHAFQQAGHGSVVLDVRCKPASPRDTPGPATGARLEFTVTDSGAGLDEAAQQRLFSRQLPGDGPGTRAPGGSGLRLEVSRRLARLMGGDITVQSRPGAGTRCTFWMPLQALADAVSPAAAGGAGLADPRRPLRVLVAEDHPVNRNYMAALLEGMGHSAHFTADGAQAVAAARRQRFDVVLMDLHMPVLDGLGATLAIRALGDPRHATVPIVALTADALPDTQERCLVAGMNDFLPKPVSPQVLASCLRRLFGTGGALPPLPADRAAAPGEPLRAEDGLVDAAAVALTLQAIPATRLAALITSFLDQGPDTVQRLRAAVRDAQPPELRVHAHAAKGAALNLGLTGLAQTAQALHDGAAHLPAHEIARLVQRYEAQLPATRLAAQAVLEPAEARPADPDGPGSLTR